MSRFYIAGFRKGTKARFKPDAADRKQRAEERAGRGRNGDAEYGRGFRAGWAVAHLYRETKEI